MTTPTHKSEVEETLKEVRQQLIKDGFKNPELDIICENVLPYYLTKAREEERESNKLLIKNAIADLDYLGDMANHSIVKMNCVRIAKNLKEALTNQE